MQKVSDLIEEIVQQYLKFIDYSVEDGLSEQKNIASFKSICSNLWHLSDWIWKEYTSFQEQYSNIGEFRSYLFGLCNELKIMHDIVNTSKHLELTRPKSNFKELRIYEGDSLSFSNPPCILIVLKNGKKKNGTKIIKKVLDFWSHFMNDLYINSL